MIRIEKPTTKPRKVYANANDATGNTLLSYYYVPVRVVKKINTLPN